MARLKVNPTRMVLNDLKDKLVITEQGYSLLKEKQDSLIRVFVDYYERAGTIRKEVENQFSRISTQFDIASLEVHEDLMSDSLSQQDAMMRVSKKRSVIMGVENFDYLDETIHQQKHYPIFKSHYTFDEISRIQEELKTNLIQLADVEAKCYVLADEIKQTRRRVNALEYKTIPDTKETIKYIEQRLDDQTRSQQARIMKLK